MPEFSHKIWIRFRGAGHVCIIDNLSKLILKRVQHYKKIKVFIMPADKVIIEKATKWPKSAYRMLIKYEPYRGWHVVCRRLYQASNAGDCSTNCFGGT
jgi:hypothetical protein